MNNSDILKIRKTISAAIVLEQQSHHMAGRLRAIIPTLHNAIRLPEDRAAEALLHFVHRYIKHVPDCLEAFSSIIDKTSVNDPIEVFLNIAKDYFLSPPEVIADHLGLDALLDEAYLAHRLMEEVNDRCINANGTPLAPIDMTRANLVAHYLIGEEFANQLDTAVCYSLEQLLSHDNILQQAPLQGFMADRSRDNWNKDLKKWPCLADSVDIILDFSVPEFDKAPTHNEIKKPEPKNKKLH